MKDYVPGRGDLVWIDFTPQAGHEQAGRRPALVLSDVTYNRSAGLAICCPITSRVKGYPFEVELPPKGTVSGVVLTDHLRSMDYIARRCEHISAIPVEVMDRVIAKVSALLLTE